MNKSLLLPFLRRLIIILFILVTYRTAYSQPWLKVSVSEIPHQDNIKTRDQLQKLQESFNLYWKNRNDKKSNGYKPFKRWEWLIESRLTEGEDRNQILWNEFNSPQAKSVAGDWIQIGPKTTPVSIGSNAKVGSGRIDCIEFHPTDPDIFWIGSPTGGLWKTTDGGDSWESLTDDLPVIGISDIAVNPKDPDIIYIATGDRDAGELYSTGVLMTTDGGQNWSQTALAYDPENSEYHYVYRLLIRPDRPDTIIAGTNKGIYIISNNGSLLNSGTLTDGRFKDMEFHPSNPDIIYASSYNWGYSYVYKSTDGGKSFTNIFSSVNTEHDIRRIELAVCLSSPDIVYALCADINDSKYQGLYYSLNSGEDWSAVGNNSLNLLGRSSSGNDDVGQGWYDLALSVSPWNPYEIYVGGINIWKSTNMGDSWSLASWGNNTAGNYVHVDQHILEYHPITKELFSGNDGGIYKSPNKGSSWTDLSSDLEILQIYRIGQSANHDDKVLMGSQDNSSILASSDSFSVVLGGDGMECIIDPSNSNILYASSQYGHLNISYDGGYNFESIQPDHDDEGAWLTPYIMHPEQNNVLYAGYNKLYRTGDRGKHWTKLRSTLASDKKYRNIAIAPSDDYVIASSYEKNIWISGNRGDTWTDISEGLPLVPGVITAIAFDEFNHRKLWISISNFSKNNKIYFSENAGETWTNYSSGLPNVPVNCLIIEKGSKSALYAGTDLGVYYRNRDMDSWINFSSGLPSVIVNELEIFYPSAKIRAGTYGRGLWESDLYTSVLSVPDAEFSASRQEACIEGNIQVISQSGPGDADSLKWILSDTLSTVFSANMDTATINYATVGYKDVGLIMFKDGQSDTLIRPYFIKIVKLEDISLITDIEAYGGYLWKGDSVNIEARNGDNFIWTPELGMNTYEGSKVRAGADSSINYHVSSTDGICQSQADIFLEVHMNDSIKYAMELDYTENGPFINYSASVEENEPHPPLSGCNTQTDWCDEFGNGENVLANTVWFSFMAPGSGIVSLDTRGFDNQIAVYDAESAEDILSENHELLAANDDYYGSDMDYAASIRKIENLISGKKYWVQLDGSGGNQEGSFYITLRDYALAKSTIEADEIIPGLGIYPNPSHGDFSLQLSSLTSGKGIIEIYSLNGQAVYSKTIEFLPGSLEISLNTNINTSGIYIIKFQTNKQSVVQKLIID